MKHIRREITPINEQDFFVLQNHFKARFDYPIHYHPEYELNLIFNTSGRRIIGDSIELFENIDIVLVGSNLLHAWNTDTIDPDARVVTIQFGTDFLSKQTLSRNVMGTIRKMLADAQRGVAFYGEEAFALKEKILALAKAENFDAVLSFLSLLHDMSIAPYKLILNCNTELHPDQKTDNDRIMSVCNYLQKNYRNKITIKDAASIVNLSPSAFSHFFKKRTYRSFTDYLVDLRIGNACKMLIETDESISFISDHNGFNNLSNFNKLFKKRKGMTPLKFRNVRQEIQMNII